MKLKLTLNTLILFCFIAIFVFIFFSFKNLENRFLKIIVPKIQSLIKEETGLNLNFKKLSISSKSFFQFSPTIKINQINVDKVLNVDELFVVIDLKSLIDQEIRIKKIIIKKLFLVLEENDKREIKLRSIKIKTSKRDKKDKLFNPFNKFSINNVSIENSQIIFYPLNVKEALVLKNFNLKLSNINFKQKKSSTINYELYSNLFSEKSYLKSKGTIGPIDIEKKVFSINGQEEITIFLKELPNSIQKSVFGKEISLKQDSKIKQIATFSGDLNTKISGNGDIEIKNIFLGTNPQFQLSINSNINHNYCFYPLKANLETNLKTKTFKIQQEEKKLGDLVFKASLSNNFHTGFVNYKINGSINGLDIKDTLNCLTKYRNILSGTFSINNFELSSFGTNPNSLSNNTSGSAVINISKGSLYILKSITRYQNLIDQIFSNAEDFTQKLSGEFIDLKANIKISGNDLFLSNIIINVSPLKILADGYIKKADLINFNAELFIDKIKTSVPLILSGTIEKPKIKPDLKKLATNKTNDLVDSILELGIRSLSKKKSPANNTQVQTVSPENQQNPNLSKEDKRKAMVNSLIIMGLQAVQDAKNQKTNTENGQMNTNNLPQETP